MRERGRRASLILAGNAVDGRHGDGNVHGGRGCVPHREGNRGGGRNGKGGVGLVVFALVGR